MEFEAVIGLEVHAHLLTESKIFCGCTTAFGGDPNHHTCPVCLGMPGVLPVLNRKVVEYALRMGLALGCKIAPHSIFARKNYFYPDLPKGYQISQYELPLAEFGVVEIEVEGQGKKKIGVTRIHMEEDAGKLTHDEGRVREPKSYVDLNRTGVPLIEIVSEPDMRTPQEAGAYLRILRNMLRYLGICDGNMEEGSFRCDANVSLRPVGQSAFGVKTELKNMNSFRNVERALEYEIKRQARILRDGGSIVQETLLWDAAQGKTIAMRSKEYAHDYRYFPDPDLVPLVIAPEWIEEIKTSLPELPDAKRERFISQYLLPPYDAGVLTADRDLADYFESCVKAYPEPKKVSNWIMSELLRELKNDEREITACPVTPDNLAAMLKMVDEGKISGKIAKDVFEEMYRSGKAPESIVAEKGLKQISDEGSLQKIVDEIVAAHPKEVEFFRAGKDKVLGFFVGQIMKATKGQANPKLVNELLIKKLKS